MQPDQFITHSLQDQRIARVLRAAIDGVDPSALVSVALGTLKLPPHRRLFLLGLGKAAERMTSSAADALVDFETALVVTKHLEMRVRPRFTVLEAGHPIPDQRSLAAGRAILDFLSEAREDDLVLCLISGGGSALATVPAANISLDDLQAVTASALASGATIEDVNVLRRQLDRIKGGGLAAAVKAPMISLLLSDVIGDRLEAIASGPTALNPTGAREALAILRKFRMRVPLSVEKALKAPPEPIPPSAFSRVQNLVIGNNALALQSAFAQAEREGFRSEIIAQDLQGEAREVGRSLAATLTRTADRRSGPFCMLAGGETTVTLTSQGTGGRNQELALAAVDVLNGVQDCMLISLATDGNDGPTDAAGAVVTGLSRSRASRLGMSPADHLARHDSYPFFDALGDLLKPGYTGTNVNDLTFLFGL